MHSKVVSTGVGILGSVPWGTHLCQFYDTKEDLLDILVPYFKAGLSNNELCMWVTSEPLTEDEARQALARAVPDLSGYVEKGQIEILPHSQWYSNGSGALALKRVLEGWSQKLEQALAQGYSGLRVSGNAAWMDKRHWKDLTEYEAEVNGAMGGQRMLALCSYSLDRCGAFEVVDVVKNHGAALVRQDGRWQVIETAAYKQAIDVLNYRASLVDAAGDALIATDTEYRVTSWNRAAEALYGWRAEEAMGKSPSELLKAEFHGATVAHVRQQLREAGRWEGEVRHTRKDGSTVTVTGSLVNLKDAAGNVTGFVASFHDISSRVEAERERERLRRSMLELASNRDREAGILDAIMNNTNIMLAYFDPQFNFVKVNPAYATGSGYTAEQLIGKDHFTLFPDAENRAIFERVRDTGEPVEFRDKPFTFLNQPQRGVTYWDWTLAPVKDPLGRVQGLVLSLAETTQRKRQEAELAEHRDHLKELVQDRTAELEEANRALLQEMAQRTAVQRELARAEERYRSLFQDSRDAVYVTSRQGTFLDVNQAALDLFGYSRQEMIGLDVFNVYAEPADRQRFMRDIERDGFVTDYELHFRRKDGAEIDCLLTSSLWRSVDGNVLGYRGIIRDVTEQRRREFIIKATNEVLSLFARTSSRREYLDAVAEMVRRWCECQAVGVRLLKHNGDIPYESSLGFSQEFLDSECWLSTRRNQCACVRLIAGTPDPQDLPLMTPEGSFCCNNAVEFEASLPPAQRDRYRDACVRYGFASIAIVPIRHRGQVLGAIHVADGKQGRVSGQIVELLESITPLLGEAIHRFELEAEVQRGYHTQSVLNQILRMARETYPLPDLLQRTLDLALSVPIFDVEARGSLFLTEGDPPVLVMKANKGLDAEHRRACARVPFGRCLCGQAALKGRGVFSSRLKAHRDLLYEQEASRGAYGIPLRHAGKTLGVMNISLPQGHRRNSAEEKFLASVAGTLAGIIVGRYTDERLRKSETSLTQAQHIAHLGNWEWDIATGQVQLSDEVYRILGLAPEQIVLTYETLLGRVHPDDREAVQTGVDEALHSGKPFSGDYRILLPDGSARDVYIYGEVVFDSAGQPVRVAGTVQDISERKQAEARLRALSRRLVLVQEEERHAIARDLHDHVGQSMTVLKLQLDTALRQGAADAGESLTQARDVAAEVISQVRSMSLELRPSMLDDLGLLPTLVWYFERLARQARLRVNFKHSGLQSSLPAEVGITAYRIVQEALQNVIRHAGVTEATVRAWVHGDTLQIEVEDRGSGFDPTTVDPDSSGLSGMQERALLLGGTLTVDTTLGSGTSVQAELPISESRGGGVEHAYDWEET